METHDFLFENDASYSKLIEKITLLAVHDRIIVRFPDGGLHTAPNSLGDRLELEQMLGVTVERDTAAFYSPVIPLKAGTLTITRISDCG